MTSTIFNHLLKQWPIERKRVKMEIQTFEYVKNEKSFLEETKSIFYNYLRATIW